MIERRKIRLNLLFSILAQIVTMVLGLIVPRIVINHYGSDTNGLVGTIGQVFTYMALLEAGIGAAARNKMYKPIKEDNKEEISYWASIARYYYRKISLFYLVIVVLMALLLPLILKTNVSYWTIFVYVLFEGLASVVIFYFVNTWNCLLNASGKAYVINGVALFSRILTYAIRIFLTSLGLNIALIQIGYFVISLVQLCIYWLYTRRRYSWINFKAAPKNSKLPDRNSYIVTEIAWTVFSSTDMIILSIFLSTSITSVYSVYSMVFVALSGILNSIYTAVNYSLGQTFFHDVEKYKKLHNLFISVFLGLMTVFMCVTYLLIIPFVKLYTKDVADVQYIYYSLPLLFCLIQLLSWTRYIPGNLTGIAGYAKKTSYISVLEAIANIVLSILLVNFLGFEGVLLATVISLPIKVIWCHWLSEKEILKRNPVRVLTIIGVNWLVFIITVICSSFVSLNINSYLSLFAHGIILTLGFAIVVFTLNCFTNKDLLHLASFLKRK